MPDRGLLVGPFPAGVDEDGYDRLRRRVLWQLPMGLYLLGVASAGERNFMTLNWAMQVSVKPKQLAVSVERSALSHRLLTEGGVFALSLLDKQDKAVVRKFVKPATDDPAAMTLNGVSYITSSTGAPIYAGCLSFLDCEVRQAVEVGSHSLFVGEVVNASSPGEESRAVLEMSDTAMSYGG